jgi:hypothetical protein
VRILHFLFDHLALGRVEAAATVSRAERGAAKKPRLP